MEVKFLLFIIGTDISRVPASCNIRVFLFVIVTIHRHIKEGGVNIEMQKIPYYMSN